MTDVPSGGGGDFLQKMLGDLLRLMPSGGGFQWPFAYQIAQSAAAGDADDPNPDPRERIRLEELSAIAELHVADVTGMRLSVTNRSPRLVPLSRGEWARRTLDAWRPVLDRLNAAAFRADAFGGMDLSTDEPLGAGADGPPDTGDSDPLGGSAGRGFDPLGGLIGQWASAMMPMMVALQIGSAVGHLAGRALGQYEIPLVPVPTEEIFVVSGNLASMANDWSLPPDDLSLWVCIHEMVHHAVLSRPHVAERLASLVVAHAEHIRMDPTAISELMSGGSPDDIGAMMEAFGNPAALGAAADSEELTLVSSQLDALVAAISGYAEHVTSTIADRIIGGHAPIGEAMRRRRVGRGDGEKVAEELLGLRLDQDQVDRGARFVAGVLDRSGDAELARLWVDEASLPTPAEIDAPGLWLARLEIDQSE